MLLDSNPYLLNMKDEELERILQEKEKEGLSKEELLDYINYNILY